MHIQVIILCIVVSLSWCFGLSICLEKTIPKNSFAISSIKRWYKGAEDCTITLRTGEKIKADDLSKPYLLIEEFNG